MTFRRDSELRHWRNNPVKKITILKKLIVDDININNFEIRQYTHNCSLQRDHTIYTIYLETDNNKIETKYNQGIQTNNNKNSIENIALCITNLNGVYSTINRLLIEINKLCRI
jgi:hypothetical protein